MSDIEIFVQGEGIDRVALVTVAEQRTVAAIVEATRTYGLPNVEIKEFLVFLEDGETTIALEETLGTAGIHRHDHVHIHRCHRIRVTVNFQQHSHSREFSPATTVRKVREWAQSEKVYNMTGVDAIEHVLQLCDSTVQPSEDMHIGSLAHGHECQLCFDLVAKIRIEG